MEFLAIIQGGIGPDEWEEELKIEFADDFMDAAVQAQGYAEEMNGFVYSIEMA